MISCEEGGELEVWGFGFFLDILVAATRPLGWRYGFCAGWRPVPVCGWLWVNAVL